MKTTSLLKLSINLTDKNIFFCFLSFVRIEGY